MIDILDEPNAIHREVDAASAADGEVVRVLLRRQYTAAVRDVWNAITGPAG